MPGKTVFVIHGRDAEAHSELAKFLVALGLREMPFEEVADSLGPSPFVGDIVIKGIESADAVIALFTPDEQASLYDPSSGESLARTDGGSRWQARPNVMFEAGIAYGKTGKEPILAVLGADVGLFSDVGGRHFVQLASKDGKRILYNRLQKVLGKFEPTTANWESAEVADFTKFKRCRWDLYDEISELNRDLAEQSVGSRNSRISLLQIVQKVAKIDPKRSWQDPTARPFMECVKRHFSRTVTNEAYWWLVVYGFFRFHDNEYWGADDEDDWQESCDLACIANRGRALMSRLRCIVTR